MPVEENTNKILHILSCGHKFADRVASLYELTNPGKNIFVEYARVSEIELPTKQRFNITFFSFFQSSVIISEFIEKPDVTHIFFHFYLPDAYPLLKAVKRMKKISVLCAGGAEIYSVVNNHCVDRLSKKFLCESLYDSKIRRLYDLISDQKKRLLNFFGLNKLCLHIGLFDFIMPCMEYDYRILKKAHPFLVKGRYVEGVFGLSRLDMVPNQSVGNDIMVGHSAYETLNHVEALINLKKIGIGKRKIYIPLSYGCAKYGDKVEELARKLFGEQAICLRTFMPLAEYMKIFQSCRYFYFRLYRQQALGNIRMALAMGGKVFLPGTCCIYEELKKLGAEVYSEDDLSEQLAIDTPLSDLTKANNQAILKKNWGRDAGIEKTKRLLHTIGFDKSND